MLASAAAATALSTKAPPMAPEMQNRLDQLAEWSRLAYRELLEAPDFITFYRSATPIDALENSRIGSRPPRRSGKPSLADLRAIPWVFSWTQARFYLPGWFGVGTALHTLKSTDAAGWQDLVKSVPGSPFLRYVFANVESSLVSANEDWMRAYAGLLTDAGIRERFLNQILAEFHRTQELIAELLNGSFAQRRPRMAYTLAIREQPLRTLHQQQVELLAQWRAAQAKEDGTAADDFLPDLFVSINAVASGLRTTG
jgi:phosphoenolpyruvate carboxylase